MTTQLQSQNEIKEGEKIFRLPNKQVEKNSKTAEKETKLYNEKKNTIYLILFNLDWLIQARIGKSIKIKAFLGKIIYSKMK